MRTPLTSLLTISYILRTTYCLLIPAGAGVAVKSSFYFLLLTTYLVLLTTYYLLLTPGAAVAISISIFKSISIAISISLVRLFAGISSHSEDHRAHFTRSGKQRKIVRY